MEKIGARISDLGYISAGAGYFLATIFAPLVGLRDGTFLHCSLFYLCTRMWQCSPRVRHTGPGPPHEHRGPDVVWVRVYYAAATENTNVEPMYSTSPPS